MHCKSNWNRLAFLPQGCKRYFHLAPYFTVYQCQEWPIAAYFHYPPHSIPSLSLHTSILLSSIFTVPFPLILCSSLFPSSTLLYPSILPLPSLYLSFLPPLTKILATIASSLNSSVHLSHYESVPIFFHPFLSYIYQLQFPASNKKKQSLPK